MVTSEAVGVDTSTVKADVDHTSRTIDVVMPGVSTKQVSVTRTIDVARSEH